MAKKAAAAAEVSLIVCDVVDAPDVEDVPEVADEAPADVEVDVEVPGAVVVSCDAEELFEVAAVVVAVSVAQPVRTTDIIVSPAPIENSGFIRRGEDVPALRRRRIPKALIVGMPPCSAEPLSTH